MTARKVVHPDKGRDRMKEIYDSIRFALEDADSLTEIPFTGEGIAFFDVDWQGTGDLGGTYVLTIREATLEVK